MNFLQAQIANPASDLIVCDTNFDGTLCVDLTVQNAQILGSQNPADYTITYHLTQTDADFGSNAVNPNSYCNAFSVETIYARLEDNAMSSLFDTTSFDLIVNIPPALVQVTPLSVCDDDFDEIVTFDLTFKANEILGGQTGITLQYYANNLDLINDLPIADPTAFQNNSNPQTIFVSGTDSNNCETVITLDIRVLPIPTPNPNPTPIEVCDDDNDGISVVDLTVRETEILNSEPGITLTYHNSPTDAETGQNTIADPTMHTVNMTNANSNGQVIMYIRVQSDFQIDSNNESCYTVVELPVVVNPLPVVILPEDTAVCVDNLGSLINPFSIGTDLGPGFIYQWTTPVGMSTTPTVTVTTAGTYSVFVTDTNSITSCSFSDSVTFTGDFPPCSLSVPEVDANSITIYPNPVSDELIVTSETNLQIENVAIYSLEGRLVRQQTSNFNQEEIRINVTKFAAGFYILKIRTTENKSITKRFIVK